MLSKLRPDFTWSSTIVQGENYFSICKTFRSSMRRSLSSILLVFFWGWKNSINLILFIESKSCKLMWLCCSIVWNQRISWLTRMDIQSSQTLVSASKTSKIKQQVSVELLSIWRLKSSWKRIIPRQLIGGVLGSLSMKCFVDCLLFIPLIKISSSRRL